MSEHLLDNPVWYALIGPHAHLALGLGAARHYPRDIAPYSAIGESTGEAHADLSMGLSPDSTVRLFRPSDEPAPSGWGLVSTRPIIQMIADLASLPDRLRGEDEVLTLGPESAAEMCELAMLTRPGPFASGTPRLGRYIGIRDMHGRLIAMAGERFCMRGHVELSAIAVHPAVRGRGFGGALAVALARAAFARGEAPFLHVYADNPATSLYTRIGFHKRRILWVIVWRRLAAFR